MYPEDDQRGQERAEVEHAGPVYVVGDGLDADGYRLALLDTTDEPVDRHSDGGGPAADIADVVPRDAATGTGPAAEYARLRFRQLTDTTGWTLAVDDNDGTVEDGSTAHAPYGVQ